MPACLVANRSRKFGASPNASVPDVMAGVALVSTPPSWTRLNVTAVTVIAR